MYTYIDVRKNTTINFSDYNELRKKIKVTFNAKGNYSLDSFYSRKNIPAEIQVIIEAGLSRMFKNNNIFLSNGIAALSTEEVSLTLKELGIKYDVVRSRLASVYFLTEINSINFYRDAGKHYCMKIEHTRVEGEEAAALFDRIQRIKTIDDILNTI